MSYGKTKMEGPHNNNIPPMEFISAQKSEDIKAKNLQISLKKTRKGQVRRIVHEVYLRDDIPCGISGCEICDAHFNPGVLTLETLEDRILIVDSSLLSHQVDFLCDDRSVNNCVLPVSVLDTVRQRNVESYSRLRRLCHYTENRPDFLSVEDKNRLNGDVRKFFVHSNKYSRSTYMNRRPGEKTDEYEERLIWKLASWYANHIIQGFPNCRTEMPVVLMTHSKQAKNRAEKEGIPTMTVFDYVQSVVEKFPFSGEKLARLNEETEISEEDVADSGDAKRLRTEEGVVPAKRPSATKRKARYATHLKLSHLESGLTQGTLFKGIIRMDRNSHLSGTVNCQGIGNVRVGGYRNINRAVDGDLVAIQLIEAMDEQDDKFYINDEIEENEEEKKDSETNVVGVVKSSSTCWNEAEKSRNKSVELDLVRTKQGTVVGILKRNWKEYTGTLVPLKDASLIGGASTFVKAERIFKPRDPRIPDIMIFTRQSNQLDRKRLVVVIDSWDRHHRYPSGHWVNVIGDADDPRTEAEVILKEYDVVTRDFSDAVLRCLPPADYTPPIEEISRRLDYRHHIVCSIDPPGCKDIDDALSCEILENGNYLVGVHIADVTHFVLPETAIDLEAAERCTTVYLVEKRTDMLPGLLTADLCSLVAGVDRLTFSILWELTPNGEVKERRFHKAIIRSSRALTYEEAQNMIDDKNDKLAKKLRQKRMDDGALELASLEVKFQVESETHDPSDVAVYKIRDTNKLVEELMLLANSTVAEYILEKLPFHSVLRRHPPPKEEALKSLQSQLASAGFNTFEFHTSHALADSLDRCTKDKDPFFNRSVRCLTTRCMNQSQSLLEKLNKSSFQFHELPNPNLYVHLTRPQCREIFTSAVYMCSGDVEQTFPIATSGNVELDEQQTLINCDIAKFRHYGLAANLYTHFTSPIRRYADVLVHRLLAVALQLVPLPNQLSQKTEISAQCDRMNVKHRNAQWASRASADFFTYRYFKKHGEVVVDALIIALKKNGFQVQIPRFGVEGVVVIDNKISSWNPETQKLTFKNSKTNNEEVLGLFDHVLVKAYADNRDFRPKTVLELVGKTPPEAYETYENAMEAREKYERQIKEDEQRNT